MRIALLAFVMMLAMPARAQIDIQPYQVAMSTNVFHVMTAVGCTNVEQFARWMADNWHTTANYMDQGDLNALSNALATVAHRNWTNSLQVSTNLASLALTNALGHIAATGLTDRISMTNYVDSRYGTFIQVTNGFLATNSILKSIPEINVAYIETDGEQFDSGSMNANGIITIPANGVYRIGFTAQLTHGATIGSASTGRIIAKLFRGGSELFAIHRHQLHEGGTETVLSSEVTVLATAGQQYRIALVQDGGVAMSCNAGKCSLWAIQERK